MSAQDAEEFVAKLTELLVMNPGQPIAIYTRDDDVILMGVMNIIPNANDWFAGPIAVGKIVESDLESAA